MDGITLDLVWRAIVAFAIVLLLVPVSIPLSKRFGMYDHPDHRKQHDEPTSYVGGILILLAVSISFMVFDLNTNALQLGTFLGCCLLLAVVGLLDDRFGISWKARFAAQISATLIMIYVGGVRAENLGDVFGMSALHLGLLSVPFTVFIVVGVINALNMIDGSDGLAGGQVLVSLALLCAFALYAGNLPMVARLVTMAAAVAGFLVWNFRFPWQERARIFLGNAGSMVLGFAIAWATVRLTQSPAHPVSPVLGPWTIAIPLIDCVALMFHRVLRGGSPFEADRNHLHHLLLEAGYKPGAIAWGLMALSLALGLGAGLAVQQGVYRPLLVLLFLCVLAGYFVLTRDRDQAIRIFRLMRPGDGADSSSDLRSRQGTAK